MPKDGELKINQLNALDFPIDEFPVLSLSSIWKLYLIKILLSYFSLIHNNIRGVETIHIDSLSRKLA
jgi:hypothetical protein